MSAHRRRQPGARAELVDRGRLAVIRGEDHRAGPLPGRDGHTVKTHVNRIFAKTGSRDRAAAICYAHQHDIG
jgi:hypothetical protein